MIIPVSRIMPPLSYLNVAAYTTPAGHVNNYSSTPRPHNCISLFYEGGATFESNGEKIEVRAGDVVFVPWQSLYVSRFTGEPVTKYLTIHCNFAPSDFVFRSSEYALQKVAVDLPRMYEDFLFMQQNIKANDFTALEVMARFFTVMSELLPRFKRNRFLPENETILSVIDFMEKHYDEDLPCPDLAARAAMSESQFYLAFKRATGLTPVEYKNHIRIRHAINLLYGPYSIEEITTLLGFNSATYFRKVFRKATGYNPLEYKKKILGH